MKILLKMTIVLVVVVGRVHLKEKGEKTGFHSLHMEVQYCMKCYIYICNFILSPINLFFIYIAIKYSCYYKLYTQLVSVNYYSKN